MKLAIILSLSAVCLGVAASATRAAPSLTADYYGSPSIRYWWGDGYAGPDLNSALTVTPQSPQEQLNLARQTSAVDDGSASATATASACAGLGNLHLYVAAQAASNGGYYTDTGYAHAGGDASFQDDLTIVPTAAHPKGSSVLLHAQLVLDAPPPTFGTWGHVYMDDTVHLNGSGNILYDYYDYYSWTPGSSGSLLDWEGQFQVGTTLTFVSTLSAKAEAQTDDSGTSESYAIVDVSNTSHTYFWPDDPTVVISTGSGASYAPTPEPATLSLLALGGLFLLRGKRGMRRP
jgi:hypothetical protein